MKHTFSIPYLFNPGLLTGRLPNHLLKKVKKAVNDPSARKQKSMTTDLVASIKNEYVTPEIPELVEYIDSMYQAWMEHVIPISFNVIHRERDGTYFWSDTSNYQ